MNKAAMQLAAIGLLSAGAASAADIRRAPVSGPPPLAPQLAPQPLTSQVTWTGCYVGGGGGYGMVNQATRFFVTSSVGVGPTTESGGRGWFGTAQVGCDVQVASNWVIGAFADYDFASIKGDMSVQATAWVGQDKLRSSWSAGGRIGWIPSQQPFLVYVSAGHTEARYGVVDFLAAASGLPANFSLAKHTYTGWFVGAGYEYGIGWLPSLFWKTEYRFARYGADKVSIFETPTGGTTTFELENRKYAQTIRSELVWRFNFGGPVVARY